MRGKSRLVTAWWLSAYRDNGSVRLISNGHGWNGVKELRHKATAVRFRTESFGYIEGALQYDKLNHGLNSYFLA